MEDPVLTGVASESGYVRLVLRGLSPAMTSMTTTCVWVPVEIGHAVTVAVRTTRPLSPGAAAEALAAMPGVRVYGATGGDPLPRSLAGTDEIGVGRLRRDPDRANVLHMWIVTDNLKKGAATSAVQIADMVRRE